MSEGEYVSLGWHEQYDLDCVVEHLRKSPLCGDIGLWGRSMGAVTALLYAQRDPSIRVVCADSPFASLPELMQELASGNVSPLILPPWLLSASLALVRMRVLALADFDVEDVVPVAQMQNCHVPMIFLHGTQDKLISMRHTRRLLRAHAGEKELLQIPGDHNSPRGFDAVQYAASFMCRSLGSSCVRSRMFDPEASPVSTCPENLVSSLPTPCRRSTTSLRKHVQVPQMPQVVLDGNFLDCELRRDGSPRCRSDVRGNGSPTHRSNSPVRLGIQARCISEPCISIDDCDVGSPNRPSRRATFGNTPVPRQPRSNARPVDSPVPMQARTRSRPHHISVPLEASAWQTNQMHVPVIAALDRIVAGVADMGEAADLLREFEGSELHEFETPEPQNDSPEPTAPAMASSEVPRLPASSCGHQGINSPVWRKPPMRRCIAV